MTEEKHSFWVLMEIPDIKDIQRLVRFIQKNKAISPWKLQQKIMVKNGRRSRRAYARGNSLSFPRRTRRYMSVLHEITHVLTPKCYAAHGPEYCTNYLYLVRHFLGEAAYEEMIGLFSTSNVKFDYGKFIK